MNISIVMATYNGEKYIKEQIESILPQMLESDELIISDDGSSDATLEIVKEYVDTRIQILNGPRQGVVKNFEQAFKKAQNEIILICDQDDIWRRDKLPVIRLYMKEHPNIEVVAHDAYIMNNRKGDSKETIFAKRNVKHGFYKNIIKSTYYGCCMAVRKEYLLKLLPFEKDILYDQYIGICAEIDKKTEFVDKKLIYHRENGENWSKKQNMIDRVKIRSIILRAALKHWRKR